MTEHAIRQSDAVALADRVSSLFACIRSAEAELGALLVEIEQRGVLELFGYRSVPRLLEHLADVPKSSAERMVKRVRAVNPGVQLDGTPIPALAAATGVAARSKKVTGVSSPMIPDRVSPSTSSDPLHGVRAVPRLRRRRETRPNSPARTCVPSIANPDDQQPPACR
jgi:hypothetical protein